MLSAPQTVEHLLRFWYPNGEASAQLAGTGDVSLSAVSSSIAEHMDAYRRGSPFSMAKRSWSLANRKLIRAHVAFANGILAWIDIDGRINIYHIMSGRQRSLVAFSGETFSNISISVSMLAAVTNAGICYVLTMSDDKLQTFQLTSTPVQSITVIGDTIAILYHPSPSESKQVDMIIWTLHSERQVQFRAELHGAPSEETSQHDRKIMIGAKRDYLDLFERCIELRRFYFTRFSFDGQILAHGSLQGFDSGAFSKRSESSIPSDMNGPATVWSDFLYPEGEIDSSNYGEIVQIQYDPQRDELCLTKSLFQCTWWFGPMSDLFFWGDVAYCLYRTACGSRVKIFYLRAKGAKDAVTTGNSSDSEIGDVDDCRRPRRQMIADISDTLFYGDDSFVIYVFRALTLTSRWRMRVRNTPSVAARRDRTALGKHEDGTKRPSHVLRERKKYGWMSLEPWETTKNYRGLGCERWNKCGIRKAARRWLMSYPRRSYYLENAPGQYLIEDHEGECDLQTGFKFGRVTREAYPTRGVPKECDPAGDWADRSIWKWNLGGFGRVL